MESIINDFTSDEHARILKSMRPGSRRRSTWASQGVTWQMMTKKFPEPISCTFEQDDSGSVANIGVSQSKLCLRTYEEERGLGRSLGWILAEDNVIRLTCEHR